MCLEETTTFSLSTDNINGNFSLSWALWKSINEITLSAWSAGFTLYYNARDTRNNNIFVSSQKFVTGNTSLTSKNKFDILTPVWMKLMPWVKSTFIRTAIIDPRYTQWGKAIGTIYYSGNTNPSDGDKIQIDNIIFEFDNNSSITSGNVLVAIADTSDNTWKKLNDIVNEKVNNVSSIIDVTTDRIYVEAIDFWYSWNNIVFSKISWSYFSVDGNGKLWWSLAWYWRKNKSTIKIQLYYLSSTSPTGKFYNSPNHWASKCKYYTILLYEIEYFCILL